LEQPAKKLRSDEGKAKKEILTPSATAAIIQQKEVLSPAKEVTANGAASLSAK
jgi:hypothetical protein